MNQSDMFKGLNREEWKEALAEQNEYLKNKYKYEIKTNDMEVEKMNQQAQEAKEFTDFMANGLKNGLRPDDERIQSVLKRHILYLNDNVASVDTKSFVNTAKFMVDDDFHRNMLESQQIGLAYYLYTAATIYASK
ncbi:TipAS antibiotic-recognition protein [Mobilisporobacter senegalensis]|uniref:TipAS antibiotic-recognition protein n=1 Tax=Mobilisporobacter senegalensis TaxID=1329262 RepID=A0A3N1XPA9_9FIRM|nr:TipAS antibiotic-recognition protein [Mobilisporobacter senegalensis]